MDSLIGKEVLIEWIKPTKDDWECFKVMDYSHYLIRLKPIKDPEIKRDPPECIIWANISCIRIVEEV